MVYSFTQRAVSLKTSHLLSALSTLSLHTHVYIFTTSGPGIQSLTGNKVWVFTLTDVTLEMLLY